MFWSLESTRSGADMFTCTRPQQSHEGDNIWESANPEPLRPKRFGVTGTSSGAMPVGILLSDRLKEPLCSTYRALAVQLSNRVFSSRLHRTGWLQLCWPAWCANRLDRHLYKVLSAAAEYHWSGSARERCARALNQCLSESRQCGFIEVNPCSAHTTYFPADTRALETLQVVVDGPLVFLLPARDIAAAMSKMLAFQLKVLLAQYQLEDVFRFTKRAEQTVRVQLARIRLQHIVQCLAHHVAVMVRVNCGSFTGD